MSNLAAEVTLKWADGTYLFCLPVTRLIELEQKCDAPFTVVYRRIAANEYFVTDLRETIRLGLIGGGLDPVKALTLIEQYFDPVPKADHAMVAQTILGAALVGFDLEDLGNSEAASTESQSVSTPLPSTDQPPSSAVSPSKASTGSRFGNSQQP